MNKKYIFKCPECGISSTPTFTPKMYCGNCKLADRGQIKMKRKFYLPKRGDN